MSTDDNDPAVSFALPEISCSSKTSLRRRSSAANSIRRSQSIVGISFEDQISALDPSAPVDERLAQIFNLALLATCRAMQNQYEDGEDENLSLLVEHVRDELVARGPVVNKSDPLVAKLSEKVTVMAGLMEEARTPVTILPPRLKSLQDYMSLVTSESQQWKDLHLARKNRLASAKAELRSVVKGETVIDDSSRSDLPRAEDAGLRSASDGLLELERLRQQANKLTSVRQHLKVQLGQRRRLLDEMSAEVDRSAKLVCRQSAELHNAEPTLSS